MFSDQDIYRALQSGEIAVSPSDGKLIQPASLDVRLGYGLRVMRPDHDVPVDPQNLVDHTEPVEFQAGTEFWLHPGQFVLGTTKEKITLGATVAAKLEGKSSLGRLGLITHSTAGFIDPGFCGNITLELSLCSPRPVLLRPGMEIGQLCFFRLDSPAVVPYGSPLLRSKYQGQEGPTPSRSAA